MTALPRRSGLIAAVLLCVLLLISPAAAQRIPERLDARDLDRYARILHLSPEQRNAAYGLYERYVNSYDEQIGTFVEPVVTEENRARTFRDRKEYFDAVFQRRIRLRDQIRAIDAEWIAQLEPLLTEDQRLNLPRVRDDRFRQTALVEEFFDDVGGVFRTTLADLSQVIAQVELSPVEVDRVDPILRDYEARLTSLIRAVEPSAIRFYWVDGLDEMITRGHGHLSLDDNQELWDQVAAEVCETKGRRAIELARRIDDLNHRTAIQIRDQLDEGNRDVWMERFYEVAFWSTSPVNGVLGSIRYARAALPRLDLPEEQRLVMESIVQEFERRMRLLGERWIQDAREALSPNHPVAFIASWYAFRDNEWADWRDEYHRTGQWLKDQLESSLGPQGWTAYKAAWREPKEEEEDPAQGFGRPLMLSKGPLEITKGEFARWLDVLGVANDMRQALIEAHAEYAFLIKSVAHRPEFRKSIPPVSEEELERITQLDRRLLDAVRAAIEAEETLRVLDAVEGSRRRMLLGLYCCGRAGGAVDPVMLLIHSGLSTEAIATAIVVTIEDLDAVDSLVTARWRHACSVHEFEVRWEAGDLTEEEVSEGAELSRLRQSISSVIAAKHYDLIRKMCDAIRGDDGDMLWRRFLRIALAPIANDELAAHALLHEAMDREDLTAHQRAKLEELVLDYHRRYADLTEQLLNRGKFADWWSSSRGDPVLLPVVPTEMWNLRDEYRQLKLDRDDLNEFARLQLELILNPDGGG